MSSIKTFSACVAAVLLTGCMMGQHHASTTRTTVDTTAPRNIYLSRTKGQRGKHFSARVGWSYGSFIQTPYVRLARDSGPLPPGLTLDERTGHLSGTPSQSGFWTVQLAVSDKHKGIPGHPPPEDWAWWSSHIEIKIFDKLTGER